MYMRLICYAPQNNGSDDEYRTIIKIILLLSGNKQ